MVDASAGSANEASQGFFVDTNVLLRRLDLGHQHHLIAIDAVGRLLLRGEQLYLSPQIVGEFWNVATRPHDRRGGLALPIGLVAAELDKIERFCVLLPEVPAIYDEWKRLVLAHEVRGGQVWDAKLAAVVIVYGVGSLLTFDSGDFARYGITTVDPSQLL